MKRIFTLCLSAVLVLATLFSNVLPASAAEKPWLPDPGPALGADAEFTQSKKCDGVMKDFYTYDVDMTLDEMSGFIVAYGEAVKDLGFKLKNVNLKGAIKCYTFTKNNGHSAVMAIFFKDELMNAELGESCKWQVILAVPATMTFKVGHGAPGIINGKTRCYGCSGTGSCNFCIGGRCNYGTGYETCTICDGSGVCTSCKGAGSY